MSPERACQCLQSRPCLEAFNVEVRDVDDLPSSVGWGGQAYLRSPGYQMEFVPMP